MKTLRILLPDVPSKYKFERLLLDKFVRHVVMHTGARIEIGVDVSIADHDDALRVTEILRVDLDDCDWQVVGPRCRDHGDLMVSAYEGRMLRGEIWKCFANGCREVLGVGPSGFLTMRDLLDMRRSVPNGVITGRMSVKEPNFDPVPREMQQDAAKAFDLQTDFEAIEQNILRHLFSQLERMPKNWREFGSLEKAAMALQRGLPVAFEATPEGTDKLDEAVCRARSKHFRDGEFVVQLNPTPMDHVMPEQVMVMARDLKDAAKEIRLGRAVVDTRPGKTGLLRNEDFDAIHEVFRERAELMFRRPQTPTGRISSSDHICEAMLHSLDKQVEKVAQIILIHKDPERDKIEAAKAMMLGTVPKNATVLELQVLKKNHVNKNGDNFPWLDLPGKISDETLLKEVFGEFERPPAPMFKESLDGPWHVDRPTMQQLPRDPKEGRRYRDMCKVINFSGAMRRQDITPEQATKLLDEWKKAWPELEKHFKWARMAVAYGMGEKRFRTLLEREFEENERAEKFRIESLDKGIELIGKQNQELHKKLEDTEEKLNEAEGGRIANRNALNLALGREAKLKEAMKKMDDLIRAVAGMNIQDQPLAVQREVLEALTAAMKAVKGEDLS